MTCLTLLMFKKLLRGGSSHPRYSTGKLYSTVSLFNLCFISKIFCNVKIM